MYTQIHKPSVVQGKGWGGDGTTPPPPLEVLISCSISKRFSLQWKAFDLLYRMRYILWVVALPGVTNKGRHLGHQLRFYQELESRLRPREMVIFFVRDMKNNT